MKIANKTVLPGPVDTDMARNLDMPKASPQHESKREPLIKSTSPHHDDAQDRNT
jgi:hypothetical protein